MGQITKCLRTTELRFWVNDRWLLANHPGIVVADTEQEKAVVVNVAIADSNIRKTEQEEIKKYLGLREQLGQVWKGKSKVVPKEH